MRFVTDDPSAAAEPADSPPSSTPSIRIIGAGLSRCATSSLQAAFESDVLACSPSMHMSRIVPRPDRQAAMLAAMRLRTSAAGTTNGGGLGEQDPHREERLKIIAALCHGFGAVCDTPGWAFTDDLMDLYPDAVILLNRRKGGGVAWRKSEDETIKFLGTRFYGWNNWLWYQDRTMYQTAAVIRQLSQERYGVATNRDPVVYDLHADWVRREAAKRGRKVIEWNAEDGWGPLCEALGKEVPKDVPFPHRNDTKEFQRIIKFLILRGLLSWTLVGGGLWAGWWYGIRGGLLSKLVGLLRSRSLV